MRQLLHSFNALCYSVLIFIGQLLHSFDYALDRFIHGLISPALCSFHFTSLSTILPVARLKVIRYYFKFSPLEEGLSSFNCCATGLWRLPVLPLLLTKNELGRCLGLDAKMASAIEAYNWQKHL